MFAKRCLRMVLVHTPCNLRCHSSSVSENMLLYWASGSIPCWKVMLCLEEKGIVGYPNKRLSFVTMDMKSEEVKKLNPRGQVPTFVDGDVVVNDSSAVCLYIENRYADLGTKLLPADHGDRARVLQRMFEISNIDYNIMKNIVHVWFLNPGKVDQKKLEPKYELARKEILRWESYLAQSEDFLTGNSFNMADLFFFPYVAFMVRFGLGLNKFPAMKRYFEHVKSRETIQSTWPPHWNEKPGNTDILRDI